MNDNRTELIPCPFCSAEPKVLSDGHRTWGLVQHNDGCLFPAYQKHEIPESDFAAWNNRTPIEYDGWFYLPKPKKGIVVYGEPEITRTENGYKVRQIADVVDEAARKWGEELGEYVMQRICEIWNSRAERTCHRVLDSELASKPGWHIKHRCSECGEKLNDVNYCPNCGAKVVDE